MSYRRRWIALGTSLLIANVLAGCPEETVAPQPKIAEDIFAPMGEIIPSASEQQRATFERGRDVVARRFRPEDGLGPLFNVSFCGACHEKPVFGGGAGHYRNFLLVRQELADGSQTVTGTNGVQPHFSLEGAAYVSSEAATNRFAQRNPIPFFGIGLLAEIPEAEILSRADENDADGDGISGRPNFDRGFVGRFGLKAQTVSIEGFIRGPLFNHLGVTSNPLSNERKNALPVPSGVSGLKSGNVGDGLGQAQQAQAAAPDEPTVDDDDVADPELSEGDLFDLVSFAMLLAAPEPALPSEQSTRGDATFAELGCAACHAPALLGPRGLVPAYSDLLLHDMGESLADHIRMGEADGAEFRTQPLWGLSATGPYLHDGRASTIAEAILAHGGEGEPSRLAYEGLSEDGRADVEAFLRSLGGQDQASDGLLVPDAPVPEVGEIGGPARPLDDAEEARFVAGRAAFDRDRGLSSGLGPAFNGDSCRACHFDPIIGGAGPIDLNVVRHGRIDGGVFTPPAMGTMVHRHSTTDGRPAFDSLANVFELRQTPSVLGLGLIDAIPEATILALEDPDDADGDGIRGRAHVLPDGRVGRFGWKANVPSLAEFARDAMANELGVTLPVQEGLTFGRTSDEDDISDPEITKGELEDVTFFMSALSPPRRGADQPDGDLLFTEAGCDACHVRSLKTSDGTSVALFSDLLLHDVAVVGATGIADGDASVREFRTPPLWGLPNTAPYLHDGSASDVEQAIAGHAGEALASAQAYQALTVSERQALLAFLGSL